MNEALKKRLIGAAVLLILAGILWPLLFDFDESLRDQPLELKIPPMPVVEAEHPASVDVALDTTDEPSKPVASAGGAKAVSSVESHSELQAVQSEAQKPVVVTSTPAVGFSEDNAAGSDAKQSTSAKDAYPRLDANRIPVSFIVQVGTFKSWDNASKFRERLVESKMKAFIKPATSVQGGPYRVSVGPVLTYTAAENLVKQMTSEHQINDAIIRRFRDS